MAEPYPRTVLTELRILLDDETLIRLLSVADDAHAPPEAVAASIIKAVLDDDFLAHFGEPPMSGQALH
jgi:hypothetical protein